MPTLRDITQLSDKAEAARGLQQGLQFFTPFPFAGMNVTASAIAIDDKEFSYIENFVRVGDGKYRALWDIGNPIFTAETEDSIVSFFFYNIGTTNYCAVFFNDGTADQINMSNFAVTPITTTAGLFYQSGGSFPACSQWGTQFLIISNRNTVNDYWLWDGSILYQAGTLAPQGVNIVSGGANYSSPPAVTTFGGEGSGATYDVKVNAGSVVEINITNPGSGYEVGDFPQLAFTGGGSDSSAILQAVLANGSVVAVNVTAPGSGYTTASVSFSGGGGTGAAATANIGSGVNAVTVTNAGSGYTTAQVGFTGGGGSGADATATISGGQIIGITVLNSGSGYTSAPTVTITGDGSGAMATATIQNGIITGITVTDPGSGYTSSPVVTITGNGTGALAQAIISTGGIAKINVANPGSGFTYPPLLQIVGGGGTGAEASAQLVGTSIQKVDIVSGGSGLYFGSLPYIIFVGGGGTGATGYPVISNGIVVQVVVTNPGSGYVAQPFVALVESHVSGQNPTLNAPFGFAANAILAPTSINKVLITNYGTGYNTAPAVVVEPGANNSAYATVQPMPFGVSGDSVETFQSRVWIANPAPGPFSTIPPGGLFSVSSESQFPYADFATSQGGVLFTNSDSFLQNQYVNIRQSNGYLYFFGDGSVSVISNIQTAGTPPTTTFNYQNVDPQIGMSWRDTRQDFSRTVLFGNQTGVYGLYGGAVTKVSAKLDDIFVNALFPPAPGALMPSSATATIFDVRHYMMLMMIKDPDTGTYRNVMVAWNERDWTIFSQGANLTYIGTQKVSSALYAYGTDGTSIYPLFQKPSSTLVKRMDTKLYGGNSPFMIKQLYGFWMNVRDMSAGEVGASFNVTMQTGGLGVQDENYPSVPTGLYQLNVEPSLPSDENTVYYPAIGTGNPGIPFVTCGAQISSTSPDFIVGNILLGYTYQQGFM